MIDFDQAVLLATNAEATHRAMGKKPIAVEAKDWLDQNALKTVIQTMSKLGRIGDTKDDLQFAVVNPSKLAIKPMPEKFFTDPFNDSEKEALNRSLLAINAANFNEEFYRRISLAITFGRMGNREKRPVKAWKGFDPLEVKSIAPMLKSERMATLPKYTSNPGQK